MKWGEFKKIAEDAGMTDDSKIFFIDIHLPEPNEIGVYKDELGWGIS